MSGDAGELHRAGTRPLHIVAVCGSLRAASKNRALLEAAQLLAPRGVEISLDWSLATLPHFNPDLDTLDGALLPEAAVAWRDTVARADGLLISSPEYAHGIPGVLKNALDWLVSSTEFPGMPVALLGASSLSVFAPAQLREILETMNARFVSEASVTIPVPGAGADAAAIAGDLHLLSMLREALDAFVRVVVERAKRA
ncbi:MAG: NAD(P)H-dependent oxidoreductase [Gemmatimonadota bacterium]|nr:NAD(P)H-dependent oxidoreductase [Gemmatimonadota bacterium]